MGAGGTPDLGDFQVLVLSAHGGGQLRGIRAGAWIVGCVLGQEPQPPPKMETHTD